MLVDRIKRALKQAYWAGVDLCPTGTSLDCNSMKNEIDRILFEFEKEVYNLEAPGTRNAALKSVVEDLLEQHERQLDMEEYGARCSYPSKFPEWDRAWENARDVLDGD